MHMKTLSNALAFTFAIAAITPAIADTWTVDPDQSKLSFEVPQGSGSVTGEFQSWEANIEFDVSAPQSATISARVNTASAATGNPQFDTTMPAKDWFDVGGFPDAEFKAEGASLVEGNSYKADGSLTIKGVSHPVVLDFTLEIEGDTAKAQGTATLNRLDYAIGSGVGTDTVGDVVTVTLDLTATR